MSSPCKIALEETSKVSWAPIIATVIGTASVPVASVHQISQVVESSFIRELRKKDERYIEELEEYLQEKHERILKKLARNQAEMTKLFESKLVAKIEEVKKYREVQINFRKAELDTERDEKLKEELQRLRTGKRKYLSRLSPDVEPADLADISAQLEEANPTYLLLFERNMTNLPVPSSNYDTVIAAERTKLLHYLSRQRQKIELQLTTNLKNTIILFEEYDRKFRAKLAARLANDEDMTDTQRDKLVKLRDQERERMRGKKDEISLDEEEDSKFLTRVDQMCVKCFGLIPALPTYYQYLGTEIDTCTIMGCSDE